MPQWFQIIMLGIFKTIFGRNPDDQNSGESAAKHRLQKLRDNKKVQSANHEGDDAAAHLRDLVQAKTHEPSTKPFSAWNGLESKAHSVGLAHKAMVSPFKGGAFGYSENPMDEDIDTFNRESFAESSAKKKLQSDLTNSVLSALISKHGQIERNLGLEPGASGQYDVVAPREVLSAQDEDVVESVLASDWSAEESLFGGTGLFCDYGETAGAKAEAVEKPKCFGPPVDLNKLKKPEIKEAPVVDEDEADFVDEVLYHYDMAESLFEDYEEEEVAVVAAEPIPVVESKPIAAKQVESKPVEKPAAPTATAKPVESKTTSKPVESKPVVAQPSPPSVVAKPKTAAAAAPAMAKPIALPAAPAAAAISEPVKTAPNVPAIAQTAQVKIPTTPSTESAVSKLARVAASSANQDAQAKKSPSNTHSKTPAAAKPLTENAPAIKPAAATNSLDKTTPTKSPTSTTHGRAAAAKPGTAAPGKSTNSTVASKTSAAQPIALPPSQASTAKASTSSTHSKTPAAQPKNLQMSDLCDSVEIKQFSHPYDKFSEASLKLIAQNPKTPANALSWLAAHRNPHIRAAVAKNTATPIETFWVLARDHEASIRYSIAENINMSPEILRELSRDRNPLIATTAQNGLRSVRESLMNALPPSSLYGKKTGTTGQKMEAAKKPDPTKSTLKNDSSSLTAEEQLQGDEEFLLMISKKPTTPARRLKELANHKSGAIRSAVAENGNTPTDVLYLLARDADPNVKIKLAANCNLPEDILDILREDRDSFVAKAAVKMQEKLAGLRFSGEAGGSDVRHVITWS